MCLDYHRCRATPRGAGSRRFWRRQARPPEHIGSPGHIRLLPEGWSCSSEAEKEAAKVGISLGLGETCGAVRTPEDSPPTSCSHFSGEFQTRLKRSCDRCYRRHVDARATRMRNLYPETAPEGVKAPGREVRSCSGKGSPLPPVR